MGDLVNAHRNRVDIDAKELDRLKKLNAAMQGDQQALTAMIQEMNTPAPTQPVGQPSHVPTPEVEALRQQVEEMREVVQQARGVTAPIQELQERNYIQATISQYAQHIPYLAKAPEQGAAMVRSQFYSDMELAKHGQHPAFPGQKLTPQNMLPQHRDTILGAAMKSCENRLNGLLSAYGVQIQAQPTNVVPPKGPSTLVDDQTSGQPTMRPAQVRIDPATGRLVRVDTGAPVAVNRMGGVVDIPTDAINPVGAGTPIPVGPGQPNTGQKFGSQDLIARMEARRQRINANPQ